jgi:proteic killer suppression protein
MIRSWGNKETEQLWLTGKSRRLPPETIKRAFVKLQSLNAAPSVEHMGLPPANRLESLSGDLAGYWSIRINEQWRLVFRFVEGDAFDVAIVDYH